jgi:sugar O-acyltransferase (sialic acid O-acetyltransferase NeuD family)
LNVVIAIANPDIRKRLVHKYKSNGNIKFPNLIDPSVIMSESIKMGEGNIICANNILTIDVTIGDFNIINLSCTIGHEVNINNFVTVNPGVNISGNVCLDDGTNIGTGAKIIQGKSIGEDSVIGAGAVVIKSIEPNSTAVGVPAKVIKGNR